MLQLFQKTWGSFKKMKLFLAQINHETNTFSTLKTGREQFAESVLTDGENAIKVHLNTGTSLGGIISGAKRLGIELIPSIVAHATPGGIVTRDFYEYFKTELLISLKKAGPIDGIILALHGAMVVEGIDDAEGDLLVAVRMAAGATLPIAVTLDFHANLSEEIIQSSNLLVGFKTFPHIDMAQRGEEAIGFLSQVIEGKLKPTAVLRAPPLLTPNCGQCTLHEPMKGIMNLAASLEKTPGVISISIFGGFAYADIPSAGVSVYVVTNNDLALANSLADKIANEVWAKRQDFFSKGLPVADAVALALKTSGKPILLADMADNVGCGAAGDGTEILAELIRVRATSAVIANIWDSEAVKQCVQAGVGKKLTVKVGGKTDDKHGATLSVTGVVRNLSNGEFVYKGPMWNGLVGQLGQSAVLDVNGIMIILVSNRAQVRDPEMIRFIGLEPLDFKILVVKSTIHYRAAFTPLAREIIEVEGPGLSTGHLKLFDYKRVRRPIFPLDPKTSYI